MKTQLEELASLYVLDQLDAAERAEFEAKLVEDAELRSVVHALESTMAGRIRALPQHEPPLDLLDAIERKLPSSSAAIRPQRSPKIVGFPWIPFARWGVAAVIAISLATLAVQSVRRSHSPLVVFVQLDPNRSTATELSLPQAAKDSDARFIELASLAESYWEKPERRHPPESAPPLAATHYSIRRAKRASSRSNSSRPSQIKNNFIFGSWTRRRVKFATPASCRPQRHEAACIRLRCRSRKPPRAS